MTLTVVDRTADNFHGKHFSSPAAGLVSNVELRTTLTGGLPAAPKLGEYLVFCPNNGMAETTVAKTQSSGCFQLKTADKLQRSAFNAELFRWRIITLEQTLQEI